jgi:hypothetical protein
MKVLFLPEIEKYLYELVEILYQKEYFGFRESATKYVRELVIEIIEFLPDKPKKIASDYFSRYGKNMFYTSFKRSRNTQWYVFFTIYEEEEIYLVRYIGTNHTCSQYL